MGSVREAAQTSTALSAFGMCAIVYFQRDLPWYAKIVALAICAALAFGARLEIPDRRKFGVLIVANLTSAFCWTLSLVSMWNGWDVFVDRSYTIGADLGLLAYLPVGVTAIVLNLCFAAGATRELRRLPPLREVGADRAG